MKYIFRLFEPFDGFVPLFMTGLIGAMIIYFIDDKLCVLISGVLLGDLYTYLRKMRGE